MDLRNIQMQYWALPLSNVNQKLHFEQHYDVMKEIKLCVRTSCFLCVPLYTGIDVAWKRVLHDISNAQFVYFSFRGLCWRKSSCIYFSNTTHPSPVHMNVREFQFVLFSKLFLPFSFFFVSAKFPCTFIYDWCCTSMNWKLFFWLVRDTKYYVP